MKKVIRQIIAVVLVIAVLITLFIVAKSCSVVKADAFVLPENNEPTYEFNSGTESYMRDGDQEAVKEEGSEEEPVPNVYTMVQQNSNYSFYFNRHGLGISLKDKETGETWYSNPSDQELSSYKLGTPYKSQIITNFIDKTAITTGEKYRYSYSSNMVEGVNYYVVRHTETDENGKTTENLRIIYLVGDITPNYNVPYCLTKEQAEKYADELKAAGNTSMAGYVTKGRGYRKITHDDWVGFEQEKKDIYLAVAPNMGDFLADKDAVIYTIIGKSDVQSNRPVMQNLEKALADSCGMTADSCKEIDESFGIVESAPDIFWIPVDYILTNDGIDVKIASDEIKYDSEKRYITSIDVLPYFGYGTDQNKGYMFVPDGSGAIVNFNNNKTNLSRMNVALYGNDDSEEKTLQPYTNQNACLPVFGIKKEKTAMFAVIEKGDTIASVVADVAGTNTSMLNQCYASFKMGAYEVVSLSSSKRKSMIYQNRINDCDIEIKYSILNGKSDNFSPDYNGMAAFYRSYLTNKGVIKKNSNLDSVPFNLELVGAYDHETAFLGISYTEMRALTTFDQAQTIIDELVKNGITNININYKGWANGGLRNSIFNRVKAVNALGGKSGLQQLIQYVHSKYPNVNLYFETDLLYVYNNDLFDGYSKLSDASRGVSREVAYHYQYDVVSKTNEAVSNTTSDPEINYATIVGPTKLKETSKNVIKKLNSLGVTGASLGNITNTLTGNYKVKDFYDRDDVADVYEQIADNFDKAGISVMGKGVNEYLLKYVDNIFEISNTSSEFVLTDYSIPFYQMIIHGSLAYSGEAFNQSGDPQSTFLQAVEAGAGLYYRWCYVPNSEVQDLNFEDMYSLNYEAWIKGAVDFYKEYNDKLSSTANAYMIAHKELAEGVVEITYDNGVAVYVNYNDTPFTTTDGVKIDAKNFTVTGGNK